jgi:hypothetical protein
MLGHNRRRQEANAPEENIARMTETCPMEIVHRIIGMLAEYLDTPTKARSTVESIVAVSSSLHVEVGDDGLGNIITRLTQQTSYEGRRESSEAIDTIKENHASHNSSHQHHIRLHRKGHAHNTDHYYAEMLVDAEEPMHTMERTLLNDVQDSEHQNQATKREV